MLAVDKADLWYDLLQALFAVVLRERNASQGKAGTAAAALIRCTRAASVVRMVVDKRAHILSDTKGLAVKSLLVHLIHHMVDKCKLFIPVMQSYSRALHRLLSHQPHLEHLDTVDWLNAALFCFAAVFGDDMRVTKSSEPFENDDSSCLDLILDKQDQATVRLTTDQITLVTCIEILFRSTNAPLLDYGLPLLIRLCRFFVVLPSETSAHLPAAAALNHLLADLTVNESALVLRAAPRLWQSLLGLWQTKSTALREQILISFRILLQFIAPAAYTVGSSGLAEAPLRGLYSNIYAEPRLESLNVDHLRLGLVDVAARNSLVFRAQTLQFGPGFSDHEAITWTMLELAADCISLLYQLSESIHTDKGKSTGPSEKKRRRVCNLSRSCLQLQ